MGRPRPVKGNAAVLWNRWRLVKDSELYDIEADPDQRRNVIEDHPDIVGKMRAHYDAWWSAVEPRVNEFSRIHVGSLEEPLTKLTPCDWQDVFLDTQGQIRRGPNKNAPWGIFVEQGGLYEFALRRWPFEADAAIDAGVPEYQGVDGNYRLGTALPIKGARLVVASQECTSTVAAGQKVTAFEVRLERGPAEVQTWFTDAAGQELCGAYYVYVRHMAD
jgi:arylsulfatase